MEEDLRSVACAGLIRKIKAKAMMLADKEDLEVNFMYFKDVTIEN